MSITGSLSSRRRNDASCLASMEGIEKCETKESSEFPR